MTKSATMTDSVIYILVSIYLKTVAALCLEGRGPSYVGWGLLLIEHRWAASSSSDLQVRNCLLKNQSKKINNS